MKFTFQTRQRARSRGVTRAASYPLIWLVNIKTKGLTSRKSFCCSGSQARYFSEGEKRRPEIRLRFAGYPYSPIRLFFAHHRTPALLKGLCHDSAHVWAVTVADCLWTKRKRVRCTRENLHNLRFIVREAGVFRTFLFDIVYPHNLYLFSGIPQINVAADKNMINNPVLL